MSESDSINLPQRAYKDGCQHHYAREGFNKNNSKRCLQNKIHGGDSCMLMMIQSTCWGKAFDRQYPGKGGRRADDDEALMMPSARQSATKCQARPSIPVFQIVNLPQISHIKRRL
jgi:hypothetical protein